MMTTSYNNNSELYSTLERLDQELCTSDRFANMTEVTSYLGIPGVYSCPKKDL
jgi:hypothetical protein